MGFFTKGHAGDQNLRRAQRELDDWNDEHNYPIGENTTLEAENLRLQGEVAAAETAASRGEKFRR